MGTMIAADPWLFTLAMRGEKQNRVAGTIMRASILTGRRQGHTLDLGTDQVRRAVLHAAAWGHVSSTPVRCSRCGCIAGLTSWARAALKSREELADSQDAVMRLAAPHIHAYLLRCPGEEYAKDLLSITSLPAERDW